MVCLDHQRRLYQIGFRFASEILGQIWAAITIWGAEQTFFTFSAPSVLPLRKGVILTSVEEVGTLIYGLTIVNSGSQLVRPGPSARVISIL